MAIFEIISSISISICVKNNDILGTIVEVQISDEDKVIVEPEEEMPSFLAADAIKGARAFG